MGVQENVVYDFSPSAEAETDLIAMFPENKRIIPCPEVPTLGVEYALSSRTCFICQKNII
jgi:hypothetical protein